MNKSFGSEDAGLEAYVEQLYVPEDELLRDIRARSDAGGLPSIQVAALDARHLEVLVRAAGAWKAVEIGTLGGYSGVSIVRGLSAGGVLHTIEVDPGHARVARETFRRAGLLAQVRIHVGQALEMLATLGPEGPFDVCFIDADKPAYPDYLDWAARHLRPGGMVIADNAFCYGGLARPIRPDSSADVQAMHVFHERLAKSGEFRATVLPTGEGLAIGVRV